nr:serine/threonine-protein kinase CDL1-like [Ipomoea batatas]
MGCFYCIRPSSKDVRDYDEDMARGSANTSGRKGGSLRGKTVEGSAHKGNVARSFTFKELATATQNFRQSNLLGEGGFGSVFKGRLDSDLATNDVAYDQIVAVKRLNLDGLQGNQEFIVEVLMLSLLHHQNLVNLIGYCTDGDQRLLVYEYMSMGSLENHLYGLPSCKTVLKLYIVPQIFLVIILLFLKFRSSLSQPFLRDRRKFVQMVDPLLEGQYSVRCLQHAVAITAMCLQEQANFRPLISDIVVALEYLVSQAECSDSQKPGVPGKTHLVPPLDPNDDHKR